MTPAKETREELFLKLQINNKIFDRHIEELKKVLSGLESENKEKTQFLKSVKKQGNNKTPIVKQENKAQTLKHPCKLTDLRLEVRNLDPDISEDDLKEYFDKFGEVIDVYIEKSPEKKLIGFLTFSHFYNERPQKYHVMKNISVKVEHVIHNDENNSRTIVVIGGDEICDLSGSDFREHFESFGEITGFRRTVNHETRKLSRFVFIEFQTSTEVDAILEKKDHQIEGVNVSILRLPSVKI